MDCMAANCFSAKNKSLKTENSEQLPSYKIHDKAEWRLQVVSYQN